MYLVGFKPNYKLEILPKEGNFTDVKSSAPVSVSEENEVFCIVVDEITHIDAMGIINLYVKWWMYRALFLIIWFNPT